MGHWSRWKLLLLPAACGIALGGLLVLGVPQVRERIVKSPVAAAAGAAPKAIKGTPVTSCQMAKWPDTSVALSPRVISANPGDSFALQVTLNTGAISRGIQLGLKFDTQLLEIVGVNEGTFYKSWAEANGGSTFMLPGTGVDTQTNRLKTLGIAILGGPDGQGVTGQGLVGTIELRAKAGKTGHSTVQLDEVVVSALDHCLNPVAAESVSISDTDIVVGGGSAPSAPSPRLVSPPKQATG